MIYPKGPETADRGVPLAKRRNSKKNARLRPKQSPFDREDSSFASSSNFDQSFESGEMLRSDESLRSDDVLIDARSFASDEELDAVTDADLEDSNVEGGEEYLSEVGLPIRLKTESDRRARQVFAELREACRACSYRRICSFAPVALHAQRTTEPKAKHVHSRILRFGLKKLLKCGDDWYVTLLNLMVERPRDGHLAGCLLAEAWRQYPDRMADLLDVVKERAAPLMTHRPTIDDEGHARKLAPGQGVDPRMLVAQSFRGQLVRAASFLEDEELFHSIHEYLEFIPDEEGRLHQHEIVAALTLFITDDCSAQDWIEELEERSPEAFRATFAWKLFEEDVIAMFFPYRRGNKRSYLYVIRNDEGREFITSIDKQPISEVLDNLFAVFDDDERKTYRIFKEICRHINVRAGKYNADLILEGFGRLKREDLFLLAIYAPSLARAVSHFLELNRFDLLIKFLYRLRSDSGRRGETVVEAHEKIFNQREEWAEIRDIVGDSVCREFFKILFRLNASYKQRVYTTNTFIKLGEAAYLLTALSGWNPRGLDMELKSRKALAYIAYGLQPPDRWSAIRARKFGRVMERLEDDEELWRSVETGARYMAELHEYPSFDALLRAAQKGDELEAYEAEPEESPEDELEASAEDFYSEPLEEEESHNEADDYESDLDDDEESDIVPPPPSPTQITSGIRSGLRSGLRNSLKNSLKSGSGIVKALNKPSQQKLLDSSVTGSSVVEDKPSMSSQSDSKSRSRDALRKKKAKLSAEKAKRRRKTEVAPAVKRSKRRKTPMLPTQITPSVEEESSEAPKRRKSSEKGRSSADKKRRKAELAKRRAEQARKSAEKSRKSSENARKREENNEKASRRLKKASRSGEKAPKARKSKKKAPASRKTSASGRRRARRRP